MLAGSLEISMMVEMSRFTQDMEKAKRFTGESMSSMTLAMAQVQKSIDAMAEAEKARASIFSRTMDETKRLLNIAKGAADDTAKSLASLKIDPNALKIPDASIQSLKTWQEKYAYAIGAGAAVGWDKAKEAWDSFKGWSEKTVVIWGVALATGVAAVVLGAVYAAYKSISFGVGLLTGESYKSANIDALTAMNKEVKGLQASMSLTAVGASALNEALKQQGTTAADYAQTINSVATATRSNGAELDRLGVKYKDQNGSLLTTNETLKNAAGVLATYTQGWDRDQAAKAIGMGSEKQIQDALAVTSEKLVTAKDRLADYGLVIGTGTQEAVSKYQESMRLFERESDLTSQGFKRAIADNIMPVLTDLSDFFRDGFPSVVMTFRYSMATVTSMFYGLKTVVYMVTESIVGSISAIGSVLGGLATAAALAMTGDFSGAKDALIKGWVDAKERLGGIGDNIIDQARHDSNAMSLAWGAGAEGVVAAAGKVGKAWDDGKAAAAAKKAAEDATAAWDKMYMTQAESKEAAVAALKAAYAKETVTIGASQDGQIALAQEFMTKLAEINKKFALPAISTAAEDAAFKQYVGTLKTLEGQLGKLEGQSESEKLSFELYGRQITLADGSVVHFTGSLEKMMLAKDAGKWAENLKLFADEVDQRKQIQEVLKAETTYREELNKVLLAGQAITTSAITAGKDQIDQYQFETGLIGKTADQMLLLNAERQIDLNYKQQLKELGDVYTEGGAGLDAEIAKLDAATKALRDGLIPELIKRRQLERDWATGSKSAYDEYVDNATNAAKQSKELFSAMYKGMEDDAFNFFRHGELSVTNFVNSIKDQLARLAAQKFTVWLVGEVGFGGSGGAGGAGGSALGAVGNAAGIYNAGSGVSSLMGGSLANGMGAMYANVTGTGIDGLLATNAAYGTAAVAADGVAGAMGGVSSALASVPVWGWAALAAIAIFGGGNHGTPTSSTGSAGMGFDASGNRTVYNQDFSGQNNGSNAITDAVITGMEASYLSAAKALGIAAVGTQFNYAGNTGENGQSPNFALGGGSLTAGAKQFYQGETKLTDADLGLAASRAVFSALKGSDLPGYMSKLFDGLTADTATQQQITDTLNFAASLRQVRDELTKTPLEIMAQDMAALNTSAASFKTDFVAAIDAGISPNNLAAWQHLGQEITQLAPAADAAAVAVRSLADIASERTKLQDQLDTLTMTAAQLLDKQRSALDASNVSLFDQVQAATTAKTAADALAQANLDAAAAMQAATDASSTAMQTFIDNVMGLVAGIHSSVTDSIFSMNYGLQDNAGKYGMLDSQAKQFDDLMRASTDINVIAKNAQLEIDTINKAFALLDPTQQASTLDQNTLLLTKIDSFVTGSGADAISIKKADNQALSEAVAAAVETAMKGLAQQMTDAAVAQASAGSKMEAAGDKIANVVREPGNITVTINNRTSAETSIS